MSGPESSRGGVPLSASEGSTSAATQGGAPFARPHALTPEAKGRIRRLLVAKAALETLFVVALASAFFYVNWNPRVDGSVASDGQTRVEGWVAGARGEGEPLEVQLFIDGHFVASTTAGGEPRAGRETPTGARGFSFDLPRLQPGEHEARVYVVHVGGGRMRLALHPVGAAVRIRAGGGE